MTNKPIHRERCAESGTLSELEKQQLLLPLLRKKQPKQGQGQDTLQPPGAVRHGWSRPCKPVPAALCS